MARQHAPATLRNREAIAQVLASELPGAGIVLEVAAGTGEHALFFASRFSALTWQPTDPAPEALASISAYRADYAGDNLAAPCPLDASQPEQWPISEAAAVLCINMVHISPWAATLGLFRGAARVLAESGGPLILYGPFWEAGVAPVPSNLAFDESLRARDARWGLREAEALDRLAEAGGMVRSARHAMPANNLMLVYRPVLPAR